MYHILRPAKDQIIYIFSLFMGKQNFKDHTVFFTMTIDKVVIVSHTYPIDLASFFFLFFKENYSCPGRLSSVFLILHSKHGAAN